MLGDLHLLMSISVSFRSGGAVWSWGSGAVGQLGLGRRIPDATTLQRVEECEVCHDVNGSTTLDLPAVRAVAAGAQHSAVVTGETLHRSLALSVLL